MNKQRYKTRAMIEASLSAHHARLVRNAVIGWAIIGAMVLTGLYFLMGV